MAAGLFVTGTDTDVGKTAVAVAIVRQLVRAGLRVGVSKPVASGVDQATLATTGDAARLWEAAGRPRSIGDVCPQAFRLPISPPRSARAEGRAVDVNLLFTAVEAWRDGTDVVVVEGAGGLYSPLGDTLSNAEFARRLGLAVVLVDAARLGAIGRSRAAVRAARAEGLAVAAVVLSEVEPPAGDPADPSSTAAIGRDSQADLATWLDPLPVTILPHGGDEVVPGLDWARLAGW